MKKAIVLLLALMMVGAVYAMDVERSATAPSFDAEATLSWGIDLDTKATGFNNAASFALTFPLVDKKSYDVSGDNVYGFIKVKDMSLKIANATPTLGGGAVYEATLFFKPFSLSVWNVPGKTTAQDSTVAPHEAAAVIPATYNYGTTFLYTSDLITAGLKMLSKGDWTTNANNDYALGATLALVPVADLLEVDVEFMMDLATNDWEMGVALPVTVASIMKGLDVTPAFDMASVGGTSSMDAGLTADLTMTEANDDDEATTFSVGGFYCANKKVELSVAFTEYLVGGFVDNLEAGVSYKMYDTDIWKLAANVGYDYIISETDDIYASLAFSTDNVPAKDLKAKVVFTDTQIANTTITATYESGNLLASTAVLGTFIVAATIAM